MAQFLNIIIKIVLRSLTCQKVPKSFCENYMYILIQKIEMKNIFITSINNTKHQYKYKLHYTVTFLNTQSGKKINENRLKFQSKPLQ